MNAIVLNTMKGAVTEYDWAFQSITPTLAGSASGLFALGGDRDNDLAIDATINTGVTLCGTSVKKSVEMVYGSISGEGDGILHVSGKNETWDYDFPLDEDGVSRCAPGKGISENYLGFGYTNRDGAFFELDRIEAVILESKNRRIT